MDEKRVGSPPKRYVKPEVVMFGHLAELTKSIVGGSGRSRPSQLIRSVGRAPSGRTSYERT